MLLEKWTKGASRNIDATIQVQFHYFVRSKCKHIHIHIAMT